MRVGSGSGRYTAFAMFAIFVVTTGAGYLVWRSYRDAQSFDALLRQLDIAAKGDPAPVCVPEDSSLYAASKARIGHRRPSAGKRGCPDEKRTHEAGPHHKCLPRPENAPHKHHRLSGPSGKAGRPARRYTGLCAHPAAEVRTAGHHCGGPVHAGQGHQRQRGAGHRTAGPCNGRAPDIG